MPFNAIQIYFWLCIMTLSNASLVFQTKAEWSQTSWWDKTASEEVQISLAKLKKPTRRAMNSDAKDLTKIEFTWSTLIPPSLRPGMDCTVQASAWHLRQGLIVQEDMHSTSRFQFTSFKVPGFPLVTFSRTSNRAVVTYFAGHFRH